MICKLIVASFPRVYSNVHKVKGMQEVESSFTDWVENARKVRVWGHAMAIMCIQNENLEPLHPIFKFKL